MYELMVLGNPAEDVDKLIASVEKFIKDASGSGLSTEKLGKKPLAYPVRKKNEGEYVVFNFEAPGTAVKTVSDKLKLEQEAVMRYLIIKAKVKSEKKEVEGEPKVAKESKVANVAKVSDVAEESGEIKPAKSRAKKPGKATKIKEMES